MKKTRLFVFAALIAAAFASCQKDENFESQSQPEQSEVTMMPFELSARTENTQMPTKLSLGVDLKPAWEEGDQLGVYDGVKIQQFDLTDLETSTFTGSLAEGATQLNAIYPYGAATAFSGGKFTASIPAEQVIEQGDSLATGALLAMARPVEIGEGQVQFAFKNVCGLIRFEISKAGQVKEFIITGNKGEKFAGEGVIGFETRIENEVEKQVPVFAPSENAATVVKVRPAGENATFAEGTYYAAIAPVTFAEGFSVTLLTVNDAATVSKGTDKEMTVHRNSGMGLQDLVSIAEWDWKIYTVEQLLAWNAAPTSPNHRVQLMADLDMTGVEWIPKDFAGVFEGNNHKIYNFIVDTGSDAYPEASQKYSSFIRDCNGNVSNLIIGSKDGKTYDGVSKFIHTPLKDLNTWAYLGVVGKISGSHTLESIVNFANVTVAESTYKIKFSIGGIAGMVNGKAAINSCVNNGDITVLNTGEPAEKKCVIGGITGKFDREGSITDCINNGDILNKHKGVWAVGGIVGNTNAVPIDMSPAITNADNNGMITMDGGTAELCAGGIAGMLRGGVLNSCDNNGEFVLGYDTKLLYGGISGRFNNEMKNEDSALILTKAVEIKNCCNKEGGIFSWTGESCALDARIGGILGNSEGGGTAPLTVSGCTNDANFEILHPRVRALGGIGGGINLQTCKSTFENCKNKGKLIVSSKTSTLANNTNYAGILGLLYGNGVDNTIVSGCSNEAEIIDKMPTKQPHYVGGIIGNSQKGLTVKNCTNKAQISVIQNLGQVVAAGIVAYSSASQIENAINEESGKIIIEYQSGTAANSQIGGLVGFISGGKLINSSNSASISNSFHTAVAYACTGGIAARAENVEISGNTNYSTAAVYYDGLALNQLCCVGGVVGDTRRGVTLTGNTNYASVEGMNHSAGNGSGGSGAGKNCNCMYAGGIVGCDSEGGTGMTKCSGNVNYGNVLAKTKNAASVNTGNYTWNITNVPGVAAGGLIGLCGFSSGIADTNVNYGNVSATSAGTAATAGALAGISNIKTAWSGKVCKTVTVNSGSGAETTPANDWVSPVYPDGYAVSATYVDAPIAE